MKKILIIVPLFLLFLLLLKSFPTKLETEEQKKEVMKQNYDFYKVENEERYQDYKLKNPNLTEEEIIIRVNLKLDKPFYTDIKETENLNTPLVLVNKYNFLKEDYIPDNLVEITNCVNGTRLLVKEANDAFNMLCNDAINQNLQIRVISSYRSYDYQKNLYNKYVEQDGIDKADTYSARPGHSEHQTGLVIDVDNGKTSFENFESTEEFKWMQENAHKYGFILRYPKGKEEITGYDYESWHYRYVGIEVAQTIHDNNLTLDEYIIKYQNKKG